MTKPINKPMTILDKFFFIKRVISKSDTPLNIEDITARTDMSMRTVQRYAIRLATEGLVDFRVRKDTTEYKYYKAVTGEQFTVNRNSSGYEYARVGYWD